MQNIFLKLDEFFLTVSMNGIWVPSRGLLYCILIIGAFLTAGVAMSAFSFYEDFYWGDKDFRDQLRLNPINKSRSQSNR